MKFSLHPKMPTTVKEMMELFPYITTKQAKRLDWKIKLRIAWDDREEKMLSYVKLVLKPIQKSNHTFNPHCEILAKAYLENNKATVISYPGALGIWRVWQMPTIMTSGIPNGRKKISPSSHLPSVSGFRRINGISSMY